jgi:RNase adapter protein RapZ
VTDERTVVVVVTGMSGAGKSTVLNSLEDLSYFCVDNLPIPVIEQTLSACERGGVRRIALGIDVRVRSFLDGAPGVLSAIGAPARELKVLFVDASDGALLRRFSSTRRPHPLKHVDVGDRNRSLALVDGITLEREWLAPLRARASQVIDTTSSSVHDLRRRVFELYGPGVGGQDPIHIRFMSFGFKFGPPADADLMLDVRFLDNPFFVDALRPLTGLDEDVRRHVLGGPDAMPFLERAVELLEFCLPRYAREGKSYLTVAIGCTGGRHRSVCLAEALALHLREGGHGAIETVHRDVNRDSATYGAHGATGPRAEEGNEGK